MIEHIAKFLDLDDLKSLRLVNKFWANSTSHEFDSRSVLVFNVFKGKSKNELENFEKHVKNFTPTNIEIYSSNRPHKSFYEEGGKSVGYEKEAKLFNDILQKLAPSVKNLAICNGRYFLMREPIFVVRENIKFPSLIKLEVESLQNYKLTHEVDSFKALFENSPNIQELSLKRFAEYFLKLLLNEDGSRNWNLLPKLNSLSIKLLIYQLIVNLIVN